VAVSFEDRHGRPAILEHTGARISVHMRRGHERAIMHTR